MTGESTIPQAKTRLLHNIANEFAGEDDFAVSYGRPTGGTAARACGIGRVVGVVDDRDRNDRRLPFGTLEERYVIVITHSVGMPTADLEAVEAQLYADLARIRRVILDDSTLGDLDGVVEVMPTGALESDDEQTDDGRFAWVETGATVTARIDA